MTSSGHPAPVTTIVLMQCGPVSSICTDMLCIGCVMVCGDTLCLNSSPLNCDTSVPQHLVLIGPNVWQKSLLCNGEIECDQMCFMEIVEGRMCDLIKK